MEIKEFAKMLDGRERNYPQFTKEELQIAMDNGFVIVYGESDDLMEFYGAIYDEGGCFGGGKVFFDKNGVLQDGEEKKNVIEAIWWGSEGQEENVIPWTYKTDIPHETFLIKEDGVPDCEAIVFSIENVS